MARIIVEVMLKPEILDPQGQAVKGALGRLGLTDVTDVRQGKRFVIDTVDDPDPALIEELAATLLSNPVIEDYQVVRSSGGCRCGCNGDCECTCNCGAECTCTADECNCTCDGSACQCNPEGGRPGCTCDGSACQCNREGGQPGCACGGKCGHGEDHTHE